MKTFCLSLIERTMAEGALALPQDTHLYLLTSVRAIVDYK